MKNVHIIYRLLIILGIFAILSTGLTAQTIDRLKSTDFLTMKDSAAIKANSIFLLFNNTGSLENPNLYDNAGYYPYNPLYGDDPNLAGHKTIIYIGGLWMAGMVNDSIRLFANYFYDDCVPGPMKNGTFQPDHPDYKIYQLYKDSLGSNPNADYLNWPDTMGAPVDWAGRPELRGDQMLWCVYNDADPEQRSFYGGETAPLGIEVRQSVWAYSEPGTDTIYHTTVFPETSALGKSIGVLPLVYNPADLRGDDYQVIINDSGDSVVWSLYDATTETMPLINQPLVTSDDLGPVVHGLKIAVKDQKDSTKSATYGSTEPSVLSPVATADNPSYTGGQWFQGDPSDLGNYVYQTIGHYDYTSYSDYGSTLPLDEYKPVLLKFAPMDSYTDLNGDGRYSIGEPYTTDTPDAQQKGYFYFYGQLQDEKDYVGHYDIPFSAWDISDTANPRQLNVIIYDLDENRRWELYYQADPPDTLLPHDGYCNNMIFISNITYDSAGTYFGNGSGGTVNFFDSGEYFVLNDGMYRIRLYADSSLDNIMLAESGSIEIYPGIDNLTTDTFSFSVNPDVFAQTGPASQSVFIEYEIFNKGGNDINDCYISYVMYPEMGQGGQSLKGCDSTADLFYAYNRSAYDPYHHFYPPAVGMKFIYGPAVSAPGENAYFFGQSIADFKNLGMSSFVGFTQGVFPTNSQMTYNYMQGIYGGTGEEYQYDGITTTYWFSGDPVAGTGDLMNTYADGYPVMGTMGPIDLQPGDSQYVLIKIAAAQGATRLDAVTNVKRILNVPLYIPTATDDNLTQLPDQFALYQNYPNPFNPATTIGYNLPRQSDVELTVYNILGQRVKNLLHESQPAGQHKIIWDGTDKYGKPVASGIYFYKIKAGQFSSAKKMLLLK